MNIGYVNVFVTDFPQALAFYRDVLGLEERHVDADFGYASFAAGPVTLGVTLAADQQQLVGRHTGIGFMARDLTARHGQLAAAGVRFTMAPEHQPWGGFMAMFADPDGNIFYLDEIGSGH